MITTTLHCSISISIFIFNIKFISQTSNKVMFLARFFLQRIMFIKFISTLQERLKIYETELTFRGEICLVMTNFTTKSGIKQLGFIFLNTLLAY